MFFVYANVPEMQDAGFVPNGNNNAPIIEGMNGVEVERRLNQSVSLESFSVEYSILQASSCAIYEKSSPYGKLMN